MATILLLHDHDWFYYRDGLTYPANTAFIWSKENGTAGHRSHYSSRLSEEFWVEFPVIDKTSCPLTKWLQERQERQGNTPSDVMVQGNTPSDVMVQGNTPSDAMVQGNTPSDAMVQGNTPSDVMVQGNTPSDVLVQGFTPSDAMAWISSMVFVWPLHC